MTVESLFALYKEQRFRDIESSRRAEECKDVLFDMQQNMLKKVDSWIVVSERCTRSVWRGYNPYGRVDSLSNSLWKVASKLQEAANKSQEVTSKLWEVTEELVIKILVNLTLNGVRG